MSFYSQVQYLSSHEGYSCGYCKSTNSNYSHGLWANTLSVWDYQNMIDRGWRRSGMYCYKPTMTRTCCPLYTIRCEAIQLKLSKSQKKNLKRMTKYLRDGIQDNKQDETSADNKLQSEGENISDAALLERVANKFKMKETKIVSVDDSVKNQGTIGVVLSDLKDQKSNNASSSSSECANNSMICSPKKSKPEITRLKTPRPGDGMDPSKPQCKKAKILRLERKQKKIQQKEGSMEVCKTSGQSAEKTLEDFIKESVEGSSTNKLEIRLLPSKSDPEIMKPSWRVFVKYQMAIHKETKSECSYRNFIEFLVSSPLQQFKDENGPPSGYGSFHQQYWLNGKLIAVGVIDVLPKCVSSVYFFYDPDYSFLSLGTYGSLRELELVRTFAKKCPDLIYYYMGFYIHSCPKMAYKARLVPSSLLCPEVYTWHSIEKCLPKLSVSKYSRLNDDKDAVCEDSIISLNEVLILWNYTAMTYEVYKSKSRSEDEDEVREYAELVGRNSSKNMLLLRN